MFCLTNIVLLCFQIFESEIALNEYHDRKVSTPIEDHNLLHFHALSIIVKVSIGIIRRLVLIETY